MKLFTNFRTISNQCAHIILILFIIIQSSCVPPVSLNPTRDTGTGGEQSTSDNNNSKLNSVPISTGNNGDSKLFQHVISYVDTRKATSPNDVIQQPRSPSATDNVVQSSQAPQSREYRSLTSNSNKNDEYKIDPINDEHLLRLEFIKIQILHKLGLNKAPKVKRKYLDIIAYSQLLEFQQANGNIHSTGSPFGPATTRYTEQQQQHYANGTINGIGGYNSAPEENDKLFLVPIKTGSCSATFNLTLDTSVHRYPIKKITMFTKMRASPEPTSPDIWDKDITLILLKGGINSTYESFLGKASPIDEEENNPFHYTESDLNNDLRWKEYDLTKLISREETQDPSVVEISEERLVVIDTDQRKLHSSFLSVEFDYMSAPRKKRRIDCDAAGNTSTCCRESFYVNFTQIGWDNWIVSPSGYFANYCKGKCDISSARYHHTTVVHKFSSIINLCCSPREMSNITLIYMDERGNIMQKTLPNMVVDSCDCA
ncbi:growth/differentiation factor 8-like [Brevipalpus obovatus]|uniref:growth/differentiation factor 8-like n=1 Tax=Brevipalpus obovatus TaxID=246614 RepID=UPI003D9E07FB